MKVNVRATSRTALALVISCSAAMARDLGPDEALNFSQAGGSSRLESAGVWWCSMPLSERMQYPSFVHNREYLENKWSEKWGDRMNELVFIGQDLDKEKIIADLEKCLLHDREEYLFCEKIKWNDPFPVNL